MLGSYRTSSGLRISQILAEYGDRATGAMGKALYVEAQSILSQSLGLVPVDTGTLKSSGYVTEPEQVGSMIHVDVGYGGPASQSQVPLPRGKFKVSKSGKIGGRTLAEALATPDPAKYAIYVHENLEAFHPVGIAKFLEIPFNAATRGMSGRIADFMNRELGGMNIGPEGPVVDYEDVVMA